MWNSEPGYSIPKTNENTNYRSQSSSRVPSSNSGSSRPPTSQNTPVTNSSNPIQGNPTTLGVPGSSSRTSPPGPSNSTFVPEKTGHKRKRVKKNEPAQLSGGGGESDSDNSEEDEAGGISVGMGGLGVVGRGAGTKGSRL